METWKAVTGMLGFLELGIFAGAWWSSIEKDHEETDQEWLDRRNQEEQKRNKELIKRILEGKVI